MLGKKLMIALSLFTEPGSMPSSTLIEKRSLPFFVVHFSFLPLEINLLILTSYYRFQATYTNRTTNPLQTRCLQESSSINRCILSSLLCWENMWSGSDTQVVPGQNVTMQCRCGCRMLGMVHASI